MLLICAVLDCHVTGKYMWAMLKSIIGTIGDKNPQYEGACRMHGVCSKVTSDNVVLWNATIFRLVVVTSEQQQATH
ncbi:hypothetical protein CY35_07G023400 [Sphagnum magellanicum]|uniref:Uncharacterized protein n=1 Tax=Sphagnum magellanicum TaxID=128215 RepID=A0ACB8HKW8_9BRYO|nr:hypothetical protein CY35_07G023400 [Sphagnum magellanicum]